MPKQFILEYWIEEGWHVGRLREVPGVQSRGKSLPELVANVKQAYRSLMAGEDPPPNQSICRMHVEIGP
jgi:predicted RNase H-like HicB family nuclease